MCWRGSTSIGSFLAPSNQDSLRVHLTSSITVTAWTVLKNNEEIPSWQCIGSVERGKENERGGCAEWEPFGRGPAPHLALVELVELFVFHHFTVDGAGQVGPDVGGPGSRQSGSAAGGLGRGGHLGRTADPQQQERAGEENWERLAVDLHAIGDDGGRHRRANKERPDTWRRPAKENKITSASVVNEQFARRTVGWVQSHGIFLYFLFFLAHQSNLSRLSIV